MDALKELIKSTFVTKNRCRYDGLMKMRINPFCKFFFVLSLILFPFALFLAYSDIIDMVNRAKLVRGDVDKDDYAHFTPYEVFGVIVLFVFQFLVNLLNLYILYVVMRECNCARLLLVFWDSPFWKYIGFQIVCWIFFILLTILIFNQYSGVILDNLLTGNLFGQKD